MPGEGSGIIIVDDDDGMSRAIERMLMTSGWSSRSFPSAEQFLAWEDFGSTDFLILDIELPGKSGLELRDHLSGIDLQPPVVFITGHDNPLLRERAMGKGALAYLTKPFPAQDLINVVSSRLGLA